MEIAVALIVGAASGESTGVGPVDSSLPKGPVDVFNNRASCDAEFWAQEAGDGWFDSDADCIHDYIENNTETDAQDPDTVNDGVPDGNDNNPVNHLDTSARRTPTPFVQDAQYDQISLSGELRLEP